jgi:hypothetical protein
MGQPLDGLPGLATPPAPDVLLAGPLVWIYRIAGALPRAFICERSEAIAIESKHPARGGAMAYGCPAFLSRPAGVVKIESARPDSVELVTTSATNGLLVLHDLYYPGWTAYVDGNSARIMPVALLFRGVLVPAGSHRVTFRFEPFSLSNLGAAFKVAVVKK